jgi:hypothetical protein
MTTGAAIRGAGRPLRELQTGGGSTHNSEILPHNFETAIGDFPMDGPGRPSYMTIAIPGGCGYTKPAGFLRVLSTQIAFSIQIVNS